MQERITYAQKKFLDMIELHQFKNWCLENNLNYELLYKIAVGNRIPTYKLMCQTCDIIPPVEWLYFTDETIPYKKFTVPKWNVETESFFIMKYKEDYKEICLKYGMEQMDGYNLFCSGRLRPSFVIIRKFIQDFDPILFFIDDKQKKDIMEYPEKGNIIVLKNKKYFTVSGKQFNKEKEKVIVCPFENDEVQTDTLITIDLTIDCIIILNNTSSYYLKFKENLINKIKDEIFGGN